MSLTPPPPGPGPRGERPLSEREKHALAGLEASLTAEAPHLSARMDWGGPEWFRRASPRVLNRTVQASAVLILALVLLPAEWRAGLVVLLVMVVPIVFGLYATRDNGQSRPPPTAGGPPT